MNRRELNRGLLAGAVALPGLARAQNGPVEGTHFIRLAQPLPVAPGKIEVVEFFWYGCPHCNAFEPFLEGWVKKVPGDVASRRLPVAFREEPFVPHQRIFFALETMGAVEAMHRKVFYAIHNDHARLDKPADIAAFMAKNGIDAAKFTDAYNSFSVQTKCRQAKALSEAYRIDGVPAIGIQGRFYTSPSLAGSPEKALQLTDMLIDRARKGA